VVEKSLPQLIIEIRG